MSYRDLEEIMAEREVAVDHAMLNRRVITYSSLIAAEANKRKQTAATSFFKQAIDANGFPDKIVMDKSGADYAGLENINILLMLGGIRFVEIIQVKYLYDLIEQDHRSIKKNANPMKGLKDFHSAKADLDGIETAHMIRKAQLGENGIPAYQQFLALAR